MWDVGGVGCGVCKVGCGRCVKWDVGGVRSGMCEVGHV